MSVRGNFRVLNQSLVALSSHKYHLARRRSAVFPWSVAFRPCSVLDQGELRPCSGRAARVELSCITPLFHAIISPRSEARGAEWTLFFAETGQNRAHPGGAHVAVEKSRPRSALSRNGLASPHRGTLLPRRDAPAALRQPPSAAPETRPACRTGIPSSENPVQAGRISDDDGRS